MRVAFYYCSGSKTENQLHGPTHEDIIRGLCHRLAWNESGHIAQSAKTFYQQCCTEHDQKPHTKRWENLLKDLITERKDCRTLFIVDGIDECSDKAERRKFLRFVLEVQNDGVYLILSSRPQVEVDEYLSKSIIRYGVVTQEAKKDMKDFIAEQFAKIRDDPSNLKNVVLRE